MEDIKLTMEGVTVTLLNSREQNNINIITKDLSPNGPKSPKKGITREERNGLFEAALAEYLAQEGAKKQEDTTRE